MRNANGLFRRGLTYSILVTCLGASAYAQDVSARPPQPGRLRTDANTQSNNPDDPPAAHEKRLFGIVPNYRTFSSMNHYAPLSVADKFTIARQDAFDRGTFILAAAFAAESYVTNADPVFGRGISSYGRYFITSYADYAIGDFMTEGIFPTMLHQDPRYFRKGQGGGFSRLCYSVGQIFLTRTDAGDRTFNGSEIFGNATAVAISQAYYPDTRDAPDAISKLGTQLGVDMASNVLKEFSPDLYRIFSRKKQRNP